MPGKGVRFYFIFKKALVTHMAIKTFSKRVLHVRRRPFFPPPVGACESLSHDLQQWTRGHSSSRCRRSRHRPRLLVNHKLIIRLRRLRRFESRKPCVAATFTLYPPPIPPHIYIDGFLTTFDTSRRTNVYVSCATLFVDVDDNRTQCVLRTLSLRPATGVPRQENFSSSLAPFVIRGTPPIATP